MAEDGVMYRVLQGDSTTRLAVRYGHFWETLWNHSQNSELKAKRKDQNVLMSGDEIFIPALRMKEETCATEKKHRFKRKGVPETLNMRLLDLYDKPLANKPFKLTIDGKLRRGTLDGDGRLKEYLPPDAYEGVLEVGDAGELARYDLRFGHLDPIDSITGVQDRLRNLGYYTGPTDGRESDALTEAVKDFRTAQGMEAKGDIDDEFRDKLKSVHGV